MHRAVAARSVVTQSLLSLVLLAACTAPKATPGTDTAAAPPQPAATDSGTAGWRSLIDGPSLGAAWRGYHSDSLPAGWTLANGVVTKEGQRNDIITRDQFGDFELEFDWKLPPGGNAGVFYRATEEYDKVYWSGPEYQLLDDAGHPDGTSRLTSAAAPRTVQGLRAR